MSRIGLKRERGTRSGFRWGSSPVPALSASCFLQASQSSSTPWWPASSFLTSSRPESSRFNRPLIQVYRYAAPFPLDLAAVVLLITFVSTLTVGPLELLKTR